MEKDYVTPVKIYSDLGHEATIRTDLERAKNSLNKVFAAWNELDIGSITDIQALINNCEQEYAAAVNRNVEVPVQPGKYQISKDVWIRTLSIPVPNLLYIACREARKHPYCQNPNLWQLVDGIIELVKDEAELLINENSIYALAPDKIALASKLKTWLELTNDINSCINGELFDSSSPVSNRFFFGKCTFENTDQRGCNGTLVFSLEALRRWLQ